MHEQDRVKLLFGPYRTPKCKIGGTLECAMRGKVKVAGLADTPIPWPYVPAHAGNGRPSLILCGDLTRAVQRESATAVAHWWGVTAQAVTKWRNALGVPFATEGTRDLGRRWAPYKLDDDTRRETAKSPERNAKIAAAKRGKPRPAHVIEAVIKAHKGKKLSEETRRKMSETHKARGSLPGVMSGPLWTPDEEALLGTMTDRDVAERIGRSESSVSSHRLNIGIPGFLKRGPQGKPPEWTAEKDAMLGTMPDTDLAQKMGCSAVSVFNRRRKLGIERFRER